MPVERIADRRWLALLLDPQTRFHWRHATFSAVPSTFEFRDRVVEDHVAWYLVDGGARVEVAGQASDLEAGSIIWVPPGVRQSCWIPEGRKSMVVYSFRFSVRRRNREYAFTHGPLLRKRCWDAHGTVEDLYEDCNLSSPWKAERVRCLLALLYTRLANGRPEDSRDAQRLNRRDRQKIKDYVRRNITSWPSPGDLARLVRLSPNYFSRVFRETYGLPPRKWLVEERIRTAAFRLINSNLAVSEIAYAMGYEDVNLFSRQFKAVLGKTPREYRGLG